MENKPINGVPPDVQMFLLNIKLFRSNLDIMRKLTEYCKLKEIEPPYSKEEIQTMMRESFDTYNSFMMKASGKMLDCIKLNV